MFYERKKKVALSRQKERTDRRLVVMAQVGTDNGTTQNQTFRPSSSLIHRLKLRQEFRRWIRRRRRLSMHNITRKEGEIEGEKKPLG